MLGFNKGIAMNIAGNRRALRTGALALAVGLVLLAGCKREADPAVAPATDTTTAQPDTTCLLYTSPSPRDGLLSRMPSSA